MDLRQLRYFIAIVEHGSFSRAAEALNVAQPALSLHVRNMEEELGSALLFRSSQGVVATEAGQILLRHARSVTDQLSAARHEIKGREAEPEGEVRLGLPGTISQTLSVPLIIEARRQFPKIRLRIAEAMSGFVMEWIREGRIDLAIVYIPVEDKALSSSPVLSEELWLLGPINSIPGIQPPTSGPLRYSAVAQLPLILPSATHGLRSLLENEAAALSLKLNTVIEVDSYINIKGLVEEGFGYSILPFNSIAREVQSGRLLAWPICAPKIKRSVHLVHPVDRPLSYAASTIETLCRATLLKLASTGKWNGARAL
ncbi:LysR family transcriptional regulator [Bradyrhizobium sp. SK17]|uniref:LysR substrate-binding domain-containing protein n=1 Tax=Bradyrhizobium sp. SK17 TaxID=2057741 RepID=UPI000C303A88|nr:LysR substrate-binding domain-containing protein [Bradyrhizobium sp. SK17]AUC95564.1 LysR family transcriptional regulator [Bradyrhizobium sp. SK17]